MSDKERISGHTHGRTRIARALHEDASRIISDDLNLWPQIRTRMTETQEDSGVRGGLSARAEHEELPARQGRAIRSTGREGNRHFNLTRMLPSALMAVCMVAFLLGAYLLPNNTAVPHNTVLNACDLITQSEVENLTGTSMDQFRWQPNLSELVACAYFGQDEMINVMVANFKSEEEANNYLETIRPDLATGLEAQQATSGYGQGGMGGRRIDVSGDEAFSNSRTPSNRNISFWDVLVSQHNRYFIITWMTSASRPDPTSQMQDLARLVASRLPAR